MLASLLARDTTCRTCSPCVTTGRCSRPGSGRWPSCPACCSSRCGGNTLTLIPLFAIGVFTGFTLSQSGLVVHWRRTRPPRWQLRAAINGLGATVTAIATAVFLLTKFTEGAWVVVIAVPAFIFLFTRIRRYYRRVGLELGLDEIPGKPAGQTDHGDRAGGHGVPAGPVRHRGSRCRSAST